MAALNCFPRKFFAVMSSKTKFQVQISNFSCLTQESNLKFPFSQNPLRSQENLKTFRTAYLFNSFLRTNYINSRSFFTTVYKNNQSLDAVDTKNCFQDMLKFRRQQAERSVLIELPSKNDVPSVSELCQKFGTLQEIHTYTGESDNVFCLVEFSNSSSAQSILHSCQCKNFSDVFPIFSRIVKFEGKNISKREKSSFTDVVDSSNDNPIPSSQKSVTISELMEEIFTSEKLPELHTRLRFFFCILLKEALSGMFPYCEAIPFGSSVNGVGCHGCDLDLMLRLYPEQVSGDSELYFLNKTCIGDVRILQQRTILCVGELLRSFFAGVSNLQKIVHARMPILKFKHKLLNLEIDISINNMSAVYMSEILHFYGEIDHRIRPLIYTVKKWAKDAGITYEVPGAWITNFSMVLLVLFFLQNRPVPMVPAINNAVRIEACSTLPEGIALNYTESLSHWKEEASSNKETLAQLLNEFLLFLGTFPFHEKHISLLTGIATLNKHKCPIWVQYPFEETLNVSKNVSQNEITNLASLARMSSKYLTINMNHKVKRTKDLNTYLGLHHLVAQLPNKNHIAALMAQEPANSLRRKNIVRKVAR